MGQEQRKKRSTQDGKQNELEVRAPRGGDPLDLVTRASRWASLGEADRRRQAVEVASARDAEALWHLTEAWLTLYGSSGAKVSKNTLQAYERGVRVLVEHWASENLLRPARDAGALYLRTLEGAGLSPATVRVRLAAAKALYKALRWAGATKAVPFADAKAGRELTPAHEKRQPYTETELAQLLEVSEGNDTLMVLLGAHAGLRVSEMCALEWRDIDFGARKLRVRRGKGGKDRRVSLSLTLSRALWEARGEGRVLTVSSRSRAYRRLRTLCLKAGVEVKGVHALRHYMGTRIYRETRDLGEAAHVLGHASLETTRVYAKYERAVEKDAVSEW